MTELVRLIVIKSRSSLTKMITVNEETQLYNESSLQSYLADETMLYLGLFAHTHTHRLTHTHTLRSIHNYFLGSWRASVPLSVLE